MSEQIVWNLKATSKRVKYARKRKVVVGIFFHTVFFQMQVINLFPKSADSMREIVFKFAGMQLGMNIIWFLLSVFGAVFFLWAWYKFIGDTLTFKERYYTLNDLGFKIVHIKNNFKKEYLWDEFENFTNDYNKYVSRNRESYAMIRYPGDIIYYLKKSDTGGIVNIQVEKNMAEQVYFFLKSKLKEI